MTRRCLAVVVVGAVALFRPGSARACERPGTPFHDVTFATTVADVVAVIEVQTVAGGVATAKVTKVLAGTVDRKKPIEIGHILTTHEAAAVGFCGDAVLSPGDRAIVLLYKPIGSGRYEPVDEVFGVEEHVTEEAKYVRALKTPLARSTWNAATSGVQTLLVANDPRNLTVIVRNAGTAEIDTVKKYAPAAEHTHCTLRVVNVATKRPVAAKPAVPKADGYGYFEKHGQAWTTKLAPGRAMLIGLGAITTAKLGWGYKEELGFEHYPIDKAGAHTISADCVNYLGAGSKFSTNALRTTL